MMTMTTMMMINSEAEKRCSHVQEDDDDVFLFSSLLFDEDHYLSSSLPRPFLDWWTTGVAALGCSCCRITIGWDLVVAPRPSWQMRQFCDDGLR